MVGVVEADADELADLADAGTDAQVARCEGQLGGIQRRELLQGVRQQRGACDVGDMGAEVPDLSILVQQAGLLATFRAIAQ